MGPSDEISRRMARPKVVLPEPDLSDDAERLALADRNADAVDGFDMPDDAAHDPALDRKPHLEILGLHDDRRMRTHRRRVRLRLRPQQCPRIVMLRRFEYAFGGTLLDDRSFLHHANRIGELSYDAEIVRYEQHRHSEARLQLFEQGEDLRLDGDIEGGRGLIRDEEIGLVGERQSRS